MNKQEWIEKCNEWKEKWPTIIEQYLPTDLDQQLNLYAVLNSINLHSSADQILMGDAGSISYAGPVALEAKQNQRLIFSPAQADMGWALPASIGVSLASKQPVLAIIGDGSFMSNLQELAVVKQHDLDIKFIILNNNGYLSIKNTQTKYYEGRVYGTSNVTGLWFPDLADVANTFALSYLEVKTKSDLENKFSSALKTKGPMIINCICLEDQEILPAQAFKNGSQAGLHDMTPFLSDQELAQEMIVKIE